MQEQEREPAAQCGDEYCHPPIVVETFSSPGCLGVLKDPTPPRLPPEEIKGRQPVRPLDKETVKKYTDDIFAHGTNFNSTKYQKGPLKAILDLPKYFDKVKPYILDASLNFDLYEFKVLKACVKRSVDLQSGPHKDFVLPSGTPTRAIIAVASRLVNKMIAHIDGLGKDKMRHMNFHDALSNLKACLYALNEDSKSWS